VLDQQGSTCSLQSSVFAMQNSSLDVESEQYCPLQSFVFAMQNSSLDVESEQYCPTQFFIGLSTSVEDPLQK
jgi:hypothetical protein